LAYLPEPQASLSVGVLLGGSARLSPAFRADLQRSGLSHLMAIDGFKQVIVAASVRSVLTRWLGPRLALLPTLATIAGYTLLAGGHPSAVRAALMVGLASVAVVSGRLADPLTSLGLAVLGMAMLEPHVLLDLGLQLSLSACLGIVLLWPTLRRHLSLYRLPRPIGEPLGLTLAVSIACLPLTLSVFEQVSFVSPLAHVVVVPLLPVVMVGAAVLALAAPFPPVAPAAAWLAWLPSSLLAGTIHLAGSLPGAAVSTGRLPPQAALGLAGGLLAWGTWQLPELRSTRRGWARWLSRRRLIVRPAACIGACLASAALLHLFRPDGRLHIDVLQLSRGQALFIRGPTGRTALVALGGADAPALAGQVAEHLAVWEHGLDEVVVFDARAQAALGPTLARYPAERLLLAGSATPVELDMGAGQTVEVTGTGGRLTAWLAEAKSAPTTSAARPGSAN
jgi:competence protein ComEC